jgi:hypothetical protein
MGLPSEFSLLHSELNGFLFATLGKEESGAPLSVLSALTRLDIDPWEEGVRLSRLSKEDAARELAPLIAAFPEEERTVSDVEALAARLAELLPLPVVASLMPAASGGGTRRTRRPANWLLWLGLGLLLAVAAMRGWLL